MNLLILSAKSYDPQGPNYGDCLLLNTGIEALPHPHHNQPVPSQAPLAVPDTFFQHQGSAKQAAPLKSCFRP